jgi:hypothetical protein
MAHLEVEPKPARPWWIWMLVIMAVLVLMGLVVAQFSK